MKNNEIDFINDRFTIIDQDQGVIAVREKTSVEIDEKCKEVKMHDFTYSFEEIIAVADKLKNVMPVEKRLTFN
tara:strand:- start:258 stop:476 length:219 start_codon:yes stop_codon:yes gene_type:complete